MADLAQDVASTAIDIAMKEEPPTKEKADELAGKTSDSNNVSEFFKQKRNSADNPMKVDVPETVVQTL